MEANNLVKNLINYIENLKALIKENISRLGNKEVFYQPIEDSNYYFFSLTYYQKTWLTIELILIFLFFFVNMFNFFLFSYKYILSLNSLYITFAFYFNLLLLHIVFGSLLRYRKRENLNSNLLLFNDVRLFVLSLENIRSYVYFNRRVAESARRFLEKYQLRNIVIMSNVAYLSVNSYLLLFDGKINYIILLWFSFFLINFKFYTFIYSFINYIIYPKIKIRPLEYGNFIRNVYTETKVGKGYIFYPKILDYEHDPINKISLYKLRKFFTFFISERFRNHNIHIFFIFTVLFILVSYFLICVTIFITLFKEHMPNHKFIIIAILIVISTIWFILVVKFLTSLFPSLYIERIRIINDRIINNYQIRYNHNGQVRYIRPIDLIIETENMVGNNNSRELYTYNFVFNILIVIMLTIIYTVIVGEIGWIIPTENTNSKH